jgi:hypothetical protein
MLECGVGSEPVEWHLKFLVEDPEAELRFQHILKTFKADANVSEVEDSFNSLDPGVHTLIVRFRNGCSGPANRALHHYDKIHRDTPARSLTRYERLLDEKDPFDD